MKRNPGHGTLFRRYLPSLDRHCYGVIRHETLLLIFDFLTPTTAIDVKHFSPSNIGGLLYIGELDKRFEKCGRIDLDGSDASRWKAAIPVSHFIRPKHFRKGPNGEDLFETYNYGDVKGIPKCVTREEITRFGIVPRRFVGSPPNDDDELLLNIVRHFRVLDEPTGLAITEKPEKRPARKPLRKSSPSASESPSISSPWIRRPLPICATKLRKRSSRPGRMAPVRTMNRQPWAKNRMENCFGLWKYSPAPQTLPGPPLNRFKNSYKTASALRPSLQRSSVLTDTTGLAAPDEREGQAKSSQNQAGRFGNHRQADIVDHDLLAGDRATPREIPAIDLPLELIGVSARDRFGNCRR